MAEAVNGLVPDDLSPALRASLQSEGIRGLPTPCEGVAWADLTDHVGHLPLTRLYRAGYIARASRHEERIGLVDNGGFGRFRTTRDLFRHHHLLTDFRSGEPIGPDHNEWVFES